MASPTQSAIETPDVDRKLEPKSQALLRAPAGSGGPEADRDMKLE